MIARFFLNRLVSIFTCHVATRDESSLHVLHDTQNIPKEEVKETRQEWSEKNRRAIRKDEENLPSKKSGEKRVKIFSVFDFFSSQNT